MPTFSPELVQIETTTACNAKCKMCPREIQQRGHGIMPTRTFWSIVAQVYGMGCRHILPFIDGDPLADNRMCGFVERMAKLYPDVLIGWYTNGGLLTEDRALRLLKVGNIGYFNISMQGGDKATYERVMGISWDRTMANVDRFLELHRELGSTMEVQAHMCVFSETKDSVEAFQKKWEGRVSVRLGAFSNFGGMRKDEYGEAPWLDKPRLVCDRALRHMYFYWDGSVGQCCFDLLGSVTYGNMNIQSLQDVVNSEKYQAMQKAHRDLDVASMPPICVNCNACKFHG
jgi:hypothetical protein